MNFKIECDVFVYMWYCFNKFIKSDLSIIDLLYGYKVYIRVFLFNL